MDLLKASTDSDGFAPSSQVEGSASRSTAWLWSGVALAAGLLLSAWLAHMQQQRADERRNASLAIVANDVRASLLDRLEQAALLVRTLQTVFETSREVSPDEFADVYATLRPRERFQGLQALAYSKRIDVGSRMTFPVQYVAPVEGNERLRGFDVATQPANLRSLITSAETDEPALSAPFALAQGDRSGLPILGVTVRLPVYNDRRPPTSRAAWRDALDGSVAASFQIDALIASAVPDGARDVFQMHVVDVTDGKTQLLYRSHAAAELADAPMQVHTLELGGRRWRIEMRPLRTAVSPLAWSRSLLLPGLVASVLFALLVGSLVNTRQRALTLGARMSERYRESEARFRALNDLLPALVLLADARTGRIRYANHAAQLRLGVEVSTLALADLFDEGELHDWLMRDAAACDGTPLVNAEALMHTANRDRFWASVSVAPIELDGERQMLLVASDISEQRQLTELLGYQATHDALTELPNRREFERRVEHALAGRAGGGSAFALLFVDLDQFKLINDTSGHAAGDQLLVQLAAVMRDELRGGDLLARLGGDEFGVLATSVDDLDGALYVAERLRAAIDAHVFVWEQRSYAVSASIGGVLVEHADVEPKLLFAQTDTACYLAKEGGRNRVHFYRERDDQSVRRRTEMEWAHRLRWAVEENRLILHYQEVWPLGVQRDNGAHIELLLRFREADGQVISPGAFIPAAERYGLMPMIDRWVIETALAHFDRLHPSGTALQLATINLSGASIEDESLSALILDRIERHGIDPRRVCFEITETVAVRSYAQVTRFIEPLRAIGCRIALDDFGAGMSSFGYLKSLPLDMIKIDGSFIHDFNDDAMSRAIVRAVTDIGHDRGFKVVAEWVPGHAVADALAKVGVDYAQGFGLHRPQTVVFQRGTERRQS
jgi:diguanylate cyclase (GGDEF)-like protein/PAS domain S-box-containing protein